MGLSGQHVFDGLGVLDFGRRARRGKAGFQLGAYRHDTIFGLSARQQIMGKGLAGPL